MKFSRVPSSRLAFLLGIAAASGLALTVSAGTAGAQTVAAPSTAPAATVPPAATPAVPSAAGTTTPAEVPAAGTKPAREAHGGSRGVSGYLAILHDELKITPAEETLWGSFADTMRANASALAQGYRQRREQLPTMNALQDMNSFIDLEQMRLDGLKKSSAAFSALYQVMPADQQKVADSVFLSDMPGAPRHKKPKGDK
jgi:protein CpxP